MIIGARDEQKASAAVSGLRAAGIDAHPLVLDVVSSDSISRAVQAVESQFGKLDSLVNNAGVVFETWGSNASESSVDTWRKTFDANVFGLIAVTQAFLPLLRKSDAGRIVNLSSILGSLTLHADPNSPIYAFKAVAYDSSKAAVNQYTVHLAYELRDTPIKVNSAHPGWVKTDMGGESAPMEIVDGAKTSVWLSTLPADGPTGGFFHLQDRLPW